MFASPPRARLLLLLGAVLLAFLALGALHAQTKRPWSDEGWFASPAVNLARHGFMGTTVLDDLGGRRPGLRQHTYWILPLHPVLLSAWFRMWQPGLFSMRAFSLLWGAVGLLALFVLCRRLLSSTGTALLAAALLSIDYLYIVISSLGRMDVMAAALGLSGLAAYLLLRERVSPTAAVFAPNVLLAAALLTHPNGVLYCLGWCLLVWRYDRRRVRVTWLLVMAVPYLIGFGLWGLYIREAPADFARQFAWNAGQGRMTTPWRSIWLEVTERYLRTYGLGGHGAGHAGPIALKALVLAAYAGGVGYCLAYRDVRRQGGVRTLLLLLGMFALFLTFFNQKLSWYLVHVVPLYCAILAVALRDLAARGTRGRLVAAGAVSTIAAIQVGGVLYLAWQNSYAQQFAPAATFVAQHSSSQSLVFASAEMAFGTNFDGRVLDDFSLGYYSGRRADLIVLEEIYDDDWAGLRRTAPEVYAHTQRVLQNYRLVYDRAGYRVYAPTAAQ